MPEVKNTPTDPSPILAFAEAATAHGWVFEPATSPDDKLQPNPKAFEINGNVYPTLRTHCGAVKVGLDSIPKHYHNGRVWRGCFTQIRHDVIVIAAIVVAPQFRRKRFATETMRSLISVADEAGFTVELEAAPMPAFRATGQRTIGFRKLVSWYKSLGFSPKYPSEGESILIRKPDCLDSPTPENR
jgi:GNAT superfamily N-acetyltransferase